MARDYGNPILPYDPWRSQNRLKSAKGSQRDRGKVASICANSAKVLAKVTAKDDERWRALFEAGRATNRKADGSYYILGAP